MYAWQSFKSASSKIKDLGSFTVPCMIGDLVNEKALAYLSASINVMPYTICLNLRLSDLQPTRMTLQSSDQSIRRPRRAIKDVLIKVDKFIFLVDFVPVDVDDDVDVPLILGRPFLATFQALIDVSQ